VLHTFQSENHVLRLFQIKNLFWIDQVISDHWKHDKLNHILFINIEL
jgi:hypothetical protein